MPILTPSGIRLGKQIASLLWCRTDESIRNDGTRAYWRKRFGRLPCRSIPNNSGLASARKWRDLTGWVSLVYSSFSGRCVANKCRGHGSRLDNNEGLCSRRERVYCGWIPIAMSGRRSSIGEEPRRDRTCQGRTGTKI